jgi:hypothetical protein
MTVVRSCRSEGYAVDSSDWRHLRCSGSTSASTGAATHRGYNGFVGVASYADWLYIDWAVHGLYVKRKVDVRLYTTAPNELVDDLLNHGEHITAHNCNFFFTKLADVLNALWTSCFASWAFTLFVLQGHHNRQATEQQFSVNTIQRLRIIKLVQYCIVQGTFSTQS